MYRSTIVNVLNQLGQFNCTIIANDDMGVMPEKRVDKTYNSNNVDSNFLGEECDAFAILCQNEYDASQTEGQ